MKNGFFLKGLCFFVILTIFLSSCTQKDIDRVSGNVVKDVNKAYQNIGEVISNAEKQKEFKDETAVNMCSIISQNNLKKIIVEDVQKYEDYTKMIDSFNVVIKELNRRINSNFKELDKSFSSYEKFTKEVTRYSPLIDNYNGFNDACSNLNSKDENSINLVYSKALSLSFESTLILSGSLHKATFSGIGEVYRFFGLNKFASICPSCVSFALSSSYWEVRNYLTEDISSIFDKVILKN